MTRCLSVCPSGCQVVEKDFKSLRFDEEENQKMRLEAPWAKIDRYFEKVYVSSSALMKMVMHARSGGDLEILGLICGKVQGNAFIVTDAYALPVMGTETRVNATEEANEFSVDYAMTSGALGYEGVQVGWYHSHPGYGCWLSGVDVRTQKNNQMSPMFEPSVAIVVDPTKTCSSGKVDIGAFRTLKVEDTRSEDLVDSDIPRNKAKEFGEWWRSYYSIPVQIFKTTVDTKLMEAMWANYWSASLCASPLITRREMLAKTASDIASREAKATRHGNGESKDPAKCKDRLRNNLATQISTGLSVECVKAAIFLNSTEV
eukprot:Selendium_serpulae@DN4951_c0_g1_i1.p1